MIADEHLLFGLIALQNDFITKQQLIAAFGIWMSDRSRSLDEILLSQDAIKQDSLFLLQELAAHHVMLRGGDLDASLQSLKTSASVRDELEQLSDSQIQHSIAKVKVMNYVTEVALIRETDSAKQRYEICRPLDRGGLGVVSVARDCELNREVALKEIRGDCADDLGFRTKFVQEAEVTGRLEHPGIVPVYGFGTGADGRPYYAMRLVKGDNLAKHIQRFHESVKQKKEAFDHSTLKRLVRRVFDVCQAIHYAHNRGYLHRDLKPGNIMLGAYGETLVVDWGLAKSLSDTGTLQSGDASQAESRLNIKASDYAATAPGSIVGTASYAPPEQLSGDSSEVTERSDVYGLGAILYELLSGEAPAHGSSLEETIRLVRGGNILPPSHHNADVPKALEASCLKAISTDPNARYRTALELADDLECWLNDLPVTAYAEPWRQRAGRWVKRHKTLVTTAAATTLVATLGLAALSSVIARSNKRLAGLNGQLEQSSRKLDDRNRMLQSKTEQLNRSVRSLDRKNAELTTSNDNEKASRRDAEKQSHIAFATLTSIVSNLQRDLKNVPGGSFVRRQMLSMSLKQLEKIGDSYVKQAKVDQATLSASIELGDIVLNFRSNDDNADDQDATVALAITFYERATEVGESLLNGARDDTEARRDCALAYGKLGDALMQAGRFNEAEENYSLSRGIYQSLATEMPDNEKSQSSHADSLERLGDLFLRSGRFRESASYFQRCLQIREELAIKSSDSEAYRDVAKSCRDIGDKALRQRDIETADEFYQRSFAITERLVAETPESSADKRAHALSLVKLGTLKRSLFLPSEANEYYQKTLQIRKPMAEDDPDNLSRQRNLATSYYLIGSAFSLNNENQLAVENFLKGLNVLDRIAQDDSDFSIQQDLADFYVRLSQACLAANQPSNAYSYAESATQLRQRAVEIDRQNVRAISDLATALRIWAAAAEVAVPENPQKAIGLQSQSVKVLEMACRIVPGQRKITRELANAQNRLGDMLIGLGDVDDAAAAYDVAYSLRRELAKDESNDSDTLRGLSLCHWKLGTVQVRRKNWKTAKASFDESIKLLNRVGLDGLRDALQIRGLADGFYTVAVELENGSAFDQALDSYRKAFVLVRFMMKSSVGLANFQTVLAKLEAGKARCVKSASAVQ